MNQVIWVLVNCNSREEAKTIGGEILKQRLASCFDIIKREEATYWWPPKSHKIETAKGAVLILETIKRKYSAIKREVKKLHIDKLPFIGFINIEGIEKDYIQWVKDEIR